MSVSAAVEESRWRLWAIVSVLAILVVAAGLGFVVLPVVQGGAAGIGAYTAICRALGILPGSPAHSTPPSEAAAQPVTRVAWTVATLEGLYRADRANGARIAQERCVACHMPDGNSPDPSIPRNAAQSAAALYKQLQDFKSGARVNETMTPLAAELDDKSITDLAAYYGRLVRGDLDRPGTAPFVGAEIENIVSNGDIARGVPPVPPAMECGPVARSKRRHYRDSTRSISRRSSRPSLPGNVTTISITACAASPRS